LCSRAARCSFRCSSSILPRCAATSSGTTTPTSPKTRRSAPRPDSAGSGSRRARCRNTTRWFTPPSG
jgi:hypothetical protein